VTSPGAGSPVAAVSKRERKRLKPFFPVAAVTLIALYCVLFILASGRSPSWQLVFSLLWLIAPDLVNLLLTFWFAALLPVPFWA